jgi:hypothetical protein
MQSTITWLVMRLRRNCVRGRPNWQSQRQQRTQRHAAQKHLYYCLLGLAPCLVRCVTLIKNQQSSAFDGFVGTQRIVRRFISAPMDASQIQNFVRSGNAFHRTVYSEEHFSQTQQTTCNHATPRTLGLLL